MADYQRVATLRDIDRLRAYLDELGIDLPVDEEVQTGPDAPLAAPLETSAGTIGNRFAVLPMEGWDGTTDGLPTDLVRRRWRRFGAGGSKLIWGGEAVAVRPDGRANPNQLCITEANAEAIGELRQGLVDAHEEACGRTDDLLVGLQLTHSGRFARPAPEGVLKPMILYSHPQLADKYGIPSDLPVLTDDQIDELIADFVDAAERAHQAGFAFVDIKHCHGYLGHEFLSSYDRPGRYGGSFENRTRFLATIVSGIRERVPELHIGTRLSAYDFRPFEMGADRVGVPMAVDGPYRHAFGGDDEGLAPEPGLSEPKAFLDLLVELGIDLVCLSAGSPYYNPHMQRPAFFPPSDGYQPPEDPLIGVARQIANHAELKRHRPELTVVGTGYSYLQEWLPNVGQHVVRTGMADVIGLGRMALSYPDLPNDVMSGGALVRKKVCRTFSDCTTAPRNGMISGCFPLDDFYKKMDEAAEVKRLKKELEL